MIITDVLLIVILFMLVRQLYSDIGQSIIVTGIAALAVYSCYWLAIQFPMRWNKRKAERRQEEMDEREYWDYKKQQCVKGSEPF